MRNLVKDLRKNSKSVENQTNSEKESGQTAESAFLPAVPASFPASNGKVISSFFHCTFVYFRRADLSMCHFALLRSAMNCRRLGTFNNF